MKVAILAGGGGTRLFPLSRNEYPKQFIAMTGSDSLLVQSIKRVQSLVQEDDIIIVTNQKYELHVRHEISKAGFKKIHVLLEPESKNTAPAIVLAVNYCKTQLKCGSDELIFVSTADHIIESEENFIQTIRQGMVYAGQNEMVVFGITPSRPETGYGYIQVTHRQNENGYEVNAFREKPDLETAQQYIDAGNYYWNAGLFLFSIQCLETELKAYQPRLEALVQASSEFLGKCFELAPEISFDYAVAEHSKCMMMIPMNCSWNDVGSWDTLDEILFKDDNANALVGDILSIDCRRNLFWGKQRLIVGIDLEDLIIVDTADVLVVSKKGSSQKVRQAVQILKEQQREEVNISNTVHRPWGSYTVLEEGPTFKVKRIVVNPGSRLSLQRHQYRSEHWVVTHGVAQVRIGDANKEVHKNESVFVPIGELHRLSNMSNEFVEIIEVQNGSYLGEDDIERFDDEYGR